MKPQLITFAMKADTEESGRTIKGLAIPANEAGTKNGIAWKFAKNSIEFGSRTPLLAYHDSNKPVGKLTASEWTDRGLEVSFSVSKTNQGDEVLTLARDGVLGLSLGIEIRNPNDAKLTEERDAEGRVTKLVMSVKKAFAREVSATPVPVFEGAAIDSATFSADIFKTKEPAMGDPNSPQVAPPVTVNFDHEAFSKSLIEALGTNKPGVVPFGEGVQSEPSLYRFDGGRGEYDFSTDLFAGAKGDTEALARAQGYIKEHFDVDQADAAALNPTRTRPDLYVDQKDYRYPLLDATLKGSLADNTPFSFPKFSSSSGLVAAHTEGTEPTPGAFAATSQTVTPAANSGKVEITREVFDQGGNPQVSGLIWRQMVRAWNESLEAAVVSLLDGEAASITDIAITTAAADEALSDDLSAAFVALQYTRGGFRFDQFAVQVDLYKALAQATDANGRPLFPMLGATNANGTVQSRFATMDIHGVTGYPSWALAATGAVSANSWLFDSEAVHLWASTPQRLNFEYRVAYVDMALWGYKATAISDYAGVRQVTYDPTA